MPGLLGDLDAAVDAVCGADPALLADGESVQVLHRVLARLEAATTRAVAGFDAGGSWAADGARTAAAWVSTRCGVPVAAARRRVRLGRALRTMPVVEAAWLAGEINGSHVGVLDRARTERASDAFERDEAMLVDHAKGLRFHHFAHVVAYWEQLADPDGVEDRAAADRDRRGLHLSQSAWGSWFLDGRLDPIAGEIVAGSLKAIEQELFEADWAEARARVGERVSVLDLGRLPAQRRADALVEMARRARAMPAGGRLPDPLFTVLVGLETFAGRVCELASRTPITPGSLVPWLGDGWVERVVFDSPDRVMNVGVRRRIFTGATRRAVEVRDRECYEEYCDTPAGDCEIDHTEPYAAGGLTIDRNGRPACSYHNRIRNHRNRPPP